jgi:DNA-binding response OmpR family regulator
MGTNLKILVTDDDPDLRMVATTILEKAGYEILEATTGQECLDTVRKFRPDLVLLDVMLPDISGIDVCMQIKADTQLQTSVILLSGVLVSSEYQAEGLNVGADGYITRPVSNKELLARVHSMARIILAEEKLREKERDQEKLIMKLQEALAEIKTLRGFIPICAACKKIRDDEGYWNRLEEYISQRTDAVFSHGLCPECADKMKAELRNTPKKS